MQPMEIHDYINERPRRYQKGTRDANQTGNNTHNDILYILLNKFFVCVHSNIVLPPCLRGKFTLMTCYCLLYGGKRTNKQTKYMKFLKDEMC